MISNYYINNLAKKAKTDMNSRWYLGEMLHKAVMEGYEVFQDKETGLIEIKKKDVNK